MADSGKKRGRRKYRETKLFLEYLENEKSYIDEIKNIFHSF